MIIKPYNVHMIRKSKLVFERAIIIKSKTMQYLDFFMEVKCSVGEVEAETYYVLTFKHCRTQVQHFKDLKLNCVIILGT